MKDFTFFPDFDCNEAFLELLNFAEEGKPGICENLVRYSKVSIQSRREYQLSVDDEAAEMLTEMRSSRRRKLHWKTEWLIYNVYARCDMNMRRIRILFGVGLALLHDAVYVWANLLCVCLQNFFPVPTGSQLLWAYPKSVIKKFRRADLFMLLNATEIRAKVASMKTVNDVLYCLFGVN